MMTKYFVWAKHKDYAMDYLDISAEFVSIDECLEFINSRGDGFEFRVICGEELKVKPVEVVSRWEIVKD